MQMEMSDLIAREAHLHTAPMLSPYFRREVEREARVQYAA